MIKLKEDQLHLGNTPSGITKTFDIELFNKSPMELVFTTNTSCGCTKPKFDTNKIKPNSSIVGKGSFKPGRGKGSTTKTITFSSNLGGVEVLTIKANVV